MPPLLGPNVSSVEFLNHLHHGLGNKLVLGAAVMELLFLVDLANLVKFWRS